jgi:hypothetical protein
MKTVLDEHNDIFLEHLIEDEKLICRVVAYKVEERNKIPDYQFCFNVEFEAVGDYVVLQEVIESALGNVYLDDSYLTECIESDLAKLLKIKEILGEEKKHFALRTAHCIVHVFTSETPKVLAVQNDSLVMR